MPATDSLRLRALSYSIRAYAKLSQQGIATKTVL